MVEYKVFLGIILEYMVKYKVFLQVLKYMVKYEVFLQVILEYKLS